MAFIFYVTQIHLDHGAVALLPQECARSDRDVGPFRVARYQRWCGGA